MKLSGQKKKKVSIIPKESSSVKKSQKSKSNVMGSTSKQ